jgi:hypothetical protein
MSTLIAVSKPNRRTLRFSTLDEVLTDARKLTDAERAGKLVRTGNWTLGQTLGHMATWVDYGFDGVPLRIPFFVRWIMRPMKKWILTKPMRSGAKIPRVAGGTLATAVIPTTEGLEHLYKAFARLASESPTLPSPLLGPMTHKEWIALHLRHAELHLSFLNAGE